MPKPSEVDQFNDPSFKTLAARILENPDFEALIKTATLDPEEHLGLPDSAFAWEERRLYPVHTAEQAALSYLYATSKEASVPTDVLENITSALQAYGTILPNLAEKEAAAPADNPADYLLPERKRWKVTDAESAKLAEDALHTYAATIPFEERVYAATQLVKKAEFYGVKLDPSTMSLAGRTVSDLDTVREWVEVRANLAGDKYAAGYTKIAETLRGVEPVSRDRESLVKLASTLHDLDVESGLSSRYGHRLPDPMATVFNTAKVAEHSVELGSINVPLSKLAALPSHLYSDIFGDDILPKITTGSRIDGQKVATVLSHPTMPRYLLSIFSKQIKAYIR